MDKNSEEKLKLEKDQLKVSLDMTKEFFDLWTKSYQSTFGKLAQVPAFGPIREKQEKIMKSMPIYTDLYTAWIESNINFQSVFTEATKRTYEKTIEQWPKLSDIKDGKGCVDPEKFKDLYNTWLEAYSDTFKEFMKSEHFASDMGKLTSVFMDFQKYNKEIIEENYLKPNNLPTKTEIDEINKELYDIKKIVKELTKKIQILSKKEEIRESTEKSEELGKSELSEKTTSEEETLNE